MNITLMANRATTIRCSEGKKRENINLGAGYFLDIEITGEVVISSLTIGKVRFDAEHFISQNKFKAVGSWKELLKAWREKRLWTI